MKSGHIFGIIFVNAEWHILWDTGDGIRLAIIILHFNILNIFTILENFCRIHFGSSSSHRRLFAPLKMNK